MSLVYKVDKLDGGKKKKGTLSKTCRVQCAEIFIIHFLQTRIVQARRPLCLQRSYCPYVVCSYVVCITWIS